MTNPQFRHRVLLSIVILAPLYLAGGRASAQGTAPEPSFATASLDEIAAPDRKAPSIFRRPSQETPALQLAYAIRQDKRGRRRSARRAYNALVHHWHTSPEAATAQMALARLFEQTGRRLRAFREYQYAAEHFSGQVPYDEILARQFALANELRGALDSGFLGFGREANADQVVSLFRTIARNAPAWHRTPDCYLMMGLTLESQRRYEEAILPYETLATRYPGNPQVATAMFQATHCRYRLATRSPRDERTLRNALAMLAATRRDFPTHPETEQIVDWTRELQARLSQMHFERAAFYDRIRRNPQAAIVAYNEFLRRFPYSREAPKAHARIEDLKARDIPEPQEQP